MFFEDQSKRKKCKAIEWEKTFLIIQLINNMKLKYVKFSQNKIRK